MNIPFPSTFTNRSRKVIELAKVAAMRRGMEYIGSEHVLLGLIQEKDGIAASVLNQMSLNEDSVIKKIEEITQAGPTENETTIQFFRNNISLTPRVKQIFEYAHEEAKLLGHEYIGTEHLLLGLIRDNKGAAFQILKEFEVSTDTVRESIMYFLGLLRPKPEKLINDVRTIVFNDDKAPDQIVKEIRAIMEAE